MKKNLVANFIGKSWGSLLSIILIPFYISNLGVEAYGLVGFYLTLTAFFGILDLGIGSVLNREIAIKFHNNDQSIKNTIRTLEIIYWLISIVIVLLIFFLAPIICKNWLQPVSYKFDELVFIIRLMGISLFFQFPISLYQGGIMGLEKQVILNIVLTFVATFRGIGQLLILLFFSTDVFYFFLWYAFSNLLCVLFLFWILWRNIPDKNNPRFDFNIFMGIKNYLAVISINSLIGIFVNQFDKILLSNLLTLELFSYYTVSTAISSVVWLVVIPINSTYFPKFAKFHEDANNLELNSLFHKVTQILSIILIPICFIIIAFSKFILSLWMDNENIVNNCYLVSSLLLFGTMLNGIASVLSSCSTAFGYPNIITKTNLTQLIIIFPLFYFLVQYYQVIGAAIGWIILNGLYFVIMAPKFFTKFFVNEKKSWIVNDLLLPILVAFSISFASSILLPIKISAIEETIWIVMTYLLVVFITFLILKEVRISVLENIKQRL